MGTIKTRLARLERAAPAGCLGCAELPYEVIRTVGGEPEPPPLPRCGRCGGTGAGIRRVLIRLPAPGTAIERGG